MAHEAELRPAQLEERRAASAAELAAAPERGAQLAEQLAARAAAGAAARAHAAEV